MFVIIDRLKYEPALFIGFVVSVCGFLFKFFSNEGVSSDDIAIILTPLISGAATRSRVVSKKSVSGE